MPKLGEKIRINLQLYDGATGLFPRANLYDASGAEIVGSPVSLSHVAKGYYKNAALDMPSTTQVVAVISVFTDSGHTTESTDYTRTMQTFDYVEREKTDAPDLELVVSETETLDAVIEEQA